MSNTDQRLLGEIMRYRHGVTFPLLLAIALGAPRFSNAGSDEAARRHALEKSVIKAMTERLTCKSHSVLQKGNLYCRTEYRGLKVEFAGVNSPRGGSLYVTSMGKNQTLSNEGRRCLLVAFSDADLTVDELGTYILIRDDGVLSGNYANDAAREACE